MALDADSQIVSSQVVDVSAGVSQLSTSVTADKLTLGRRGFSEMLNFIVAIEAITAAAAAANVIPVQFVLQYSLDAGSNYVDAATITLTQAGSLAQKRVWSAPVGLRDFRDETQGVNDLVVRVKVTYTDNAETDDFTYSAYLAGPNPYPGDDIGISY